MQFFYQIKLVEYDEHYEEEIFFTRTVSVKSNSSIITSKDDEKALRKAKRLAKELGVRLVDVIDEEGMTLFER